MKTGWLVWVVLVGLLVGPGVCAGEECEGNLLENGSFEIRFEEDPAVPLGWFYFCSTEKREVYVTSDNALTGTNSLYLGAQGVKNASEGLAQEIPVVPGETYVFEVRMLHDKKHRMGRTVSGATGIEWRSNGEEIDRILSEYWTRDLSRMRWEQMTLEDEAPRDATHARFVVYYFDGERAGTGGCFVDDACVTVK